MKAGSCRSLPDLRASLRAEWQALDPRLAANRLALRSSVWYPLSMPLYFAYGSNINLPHLREWLTDHGVKPDDLGEPRHAILPGHRLRTNYFSAVHDAGAANIEPAEGHAVEGLVMDIAPPIQDALRRKEGWPHRYDEIQVEVKVVATGKLVTAMTFIVNPKRRCFTDLPVTQRYRNLILEGARAAGFSSACRKTLHTVLRSPQVNCSLAEVTEQPPISN